MAYLVDYSNDYAYVDGIETVTLSPRNPTAADVEDVKARKGTLSLREIQEAQSVGFDSADQAWNLYIGTLGSTVPDNGDLITDGSGVQYVILSVGRRADDAQFRCLCRRAVT